MVSSSGQAEEDDVTLVGVRSDQVSVVGELTCLFLFLNHVSITIILMIIIMLSVTFLFSVGKRL